VLAEVVYKMRTTQNLTVQDYKIVDALRKKVQSLSRTKAIQNSTQPRFKVYHSISRILLQKQDYKSLEKYLSQTKEEFENERLFTRQTHDALLQMLTYLANAQFKNGKHKESLATAEELKSAMQQFGGLLHDKYLFFYYNILVMNYSVSDRKRAIEILTEVKDHAVIKKLPFYIVFVHLNLAVLNFDSGNYKQAVRALIKLTMEPGYPSRDIVLRMKIAVAELAMRYEVGDIDILERRIDQVRKDFSDQLKQKEGKKQKELIDLVDLFSKSTAIVRDKTIQKKIDAFLNTYSSETGTEDVINYHIWLSSKKA
jgi:tetratricopeptide (TPR) repeat protein